MLRHFTIPFFIRIKCRRLYDHDLQCAWVFRNPGGKSSYERQALVHEFVNELDPAVVCMQEYPMKSRKHARYLDHLNKELELANKHISDFNTESKGLPIRL
ncbi:MAG: hypothetical protein IPF68_06435 [Bacteroidales bacterium]|nr:hypothetical protein [Bacteroidales bacterium]